VTEEVRSFISDEALDQTLDTSKDPVLQKLESLLTDRVGKPLAPEKHSEAIREAQRRIDAGLPPGYKDKNKAGEMSSGDSKQSSGRPMFSS
jgi:hypothetical protein